MAGFRSHCTVGFQPNHTTGFRHRCFRPHDPHLTPHYLPHLADHDIHYQLLDRKMPVKPVDSPRLALEFIRSLEANDEQANGADAADTKADESDKKAEEAAEKVAEKVEEDKEAGGKTEDAGANEG